MNGLHTVARRQLMIPIGSIRRFAGKTADENRGKIPAHVAVFTFLLLPCFALAGVFYQGQEKRQEELEKTLRERYGDKLQDVSKKNEAMKEFFQQAIINAESGAQDERLKQVLHGGKGDVKRVHPVDKELYGTALGVEERKKMQEELALEKESKKERRRQRKLQRKAAKEKLEAESIAESNGNSDGKSSFNVTQTATVVSLAALAATVAFFVGGSRR